MNNIPTISQLRADEKLLRRTVTAALYGPDNLFHSSGSSMNPRTCLKCGRQYDALAEGILGCTVPDEAEGSMAELAELLRVHILGKTDHVVLRVFEIVTAYFAMKNMERSNRPLDDLRITSEWWILVGSLDHILCCLLALGKAKVDE